MRTAFSFLCFGIIALGVYWILQGLNFLPGSYGTCQISATVRGVGTLVGGPVVLLLPTETGAEFPTATGWDQPPVDRCRPVALIWLATIGKAETPPFHSSL